MLISEGVKQSLLGSKGQGTSVVPALSSPLALHFHKWPHGVTVLSRLGWRRRSGPSLNPTARSAVFSADFWLIEKTLLRLEAPWPVRGEGPQSVGEEEEQQRVPQ